MPKTGTSSSICERLFTGSICCCGMGAVARAAGLSAVGGLLLVTGAMAVYLVAAMVWLTRENARLAGERDRSEATKTAIEHLVENAEAGRPFLLVLGASGAGKSLLAQAGIVPALGVRGVVSGVGLWRRAVMRPGGHPGGPFLALAAALAGDDALPELLEGQGEAALALGGKVGSWCVTSE